MLFSIVNFYNLNLQLSYFRIVANGTVFSLTVITEYGQSSIELEGSLEDCDFVECLQPSSIIVSVFTQFKVVSIIFRITKATRLAISISSICRINVPTVQRMFSLFG